MKKIIFIANNNVGTGFSGGDRIFTEFLKNWKGKADLILLGSEEALNMSKERGIDIKLVQTDKVNKSMPGGTLDFITHIFRRTFKGIICIRKNKKELRDADFVYSASDFYPDFIPAIILKLKNPKIKWIAGYYLFAPSPFSSESVYRGKDKLKGIFYWFTQIFSHFLIKNFADYVFVTNEPDRKKFIGKRFDEGKVIAIRGGVDIDLANSVSETDKEYDAVFIGRFHPTKGVMELIDAWAEVCEKKHKARLGLIGVGVLENEMRDKVARLNLQDNIVFLGFVDGLEKNKIFKKSRVALYPSTLDHWSMAPVEAMAAGLPLVTFNVGTLKHLDPKGMIRVDCFDIKEFAQGIIDLLGDKVLYENMRKEAYDWASKWDWKVRSKEIFDILNKEENE